MKQEDIVFHLLCCHIAIQDRARRSPHHYLQGYTLEAEGSNTMQQNLGKWGARDKGAMPPGSRVKKSLGPEAT